MHDSFGRKIDYLRLSVTDHCNLRCLYCLPERGFLGSPSGELLTDEEILRLAKTAVRLGIDKIRITGGEPLVRPKIVELISRLAAAPGLEDLSLSTNGILLSRMAQDLRAAGLKRVNISLDTLRSERFETITRLGELKSVLDGIEKALEIGFSPVKINVVVMKGINEDEIGDFVRVTHLLPVHVRFIELMPIGETGFFSRQRWLPLEEMKARCGPLTPLNGSGPRGYGPASYFKSPGALGTVGFIAALSCNFCGKCNRLRLSSRGRLLPCLASDLGTDLKTPLRSGAGDQEIEDLIRRTIAMKPERHQMEASEGKVREAFMCALGG